MEIPYQGRAVINDLYNGAEIVILSFRQAILWLQAVVFLGFFTLFSYYIGVDKTTAGASDQGGHMAYVLYGIIIVGLITVAYALWWTLMGKEVVTIADGVLTVNKVNALEKPKSYDLKLAANFRAEEEQVRRGKNFGRIEGY